MDVKQKSFFDEPEPPILDDPWTDDGPVGELASTIGSYLRTSDTYNRRILPIAEQVKVNVPPVPSGPRYCAFDLEIAQPFELGRPFGISCAATLNSNGELTLWHGYGPGGAPLPDRMNPMEVQELAGYLLHQQAQGYTVVTFNGLGFDMDVLGEECQNAHWRADVAKLALEHIDIGFEMHCQMGYMTGLAKLSEGLGVGGKTEGMHGDLAPFIWSGNLEAATDEQREQISALSVEPGTRKAQDLCLEYVGQDAKLTADVYKALLDQRYVYWTTQRGTQSRYPWTPETKDGRLLTVNESLLIPEPDTSWMSNPRTRADLLKWTQQ